MHKAFFFSTLILVGPLVGACRMPAREGLGSRIAGSPAPLGQASAQQLSPPAPRATAAAERSVQDGVAERPQAQGDPWLVGISPSLLPNLGLTATVAREIGTWHGSGLALETEFTDQFADDKSFTKSTDPAAGNWTQAKFGLRLAKPYDDDRWLSLRAGGVWFRARGRPNIVENADDYYGAFVEFGFEARLGEHWIVGPSLSTMVVLDESNHNTHVVPMITWRILYSF